MAKESLERFDNLIEQLDGLSDTNLDALVGRVFALTPWQGSPPGDSSIDPRLRDEDGFALVPGLDGEYNYKNYSALQKACWAKFNQNPFILTTVTDMVGRLTGDGFEQRSRFDKVDMFMHKVWTDPRNMLVQNFSKYIARSLVQGELFLVNTAHEDGFVEVDFMSPSVIKGFTDNSGVLTAKGKPLFPLMYRAETTAEDGVGTEEKFIPHINLAYYPELWSQVTANKHVKTSKIIGKSSSKKFAPLNGYRTFIVPWDQGFVTKRNVGRVKVALEWLEHYDNIKKWELDHKKSSGAYLWTIEVEDRAAFRLWLAMSDEERAKTGLMGKKTPGGTIMLPPGFKLTCQNPKLAAITNQDEDIKEMISAGLNTPEDVMTGSSRGVTYSGTKMSRGPVSDRIQDQISDLDRWLKFSFWRGALWLHSKVTGMNWEHKVSRVYKFEDKEPKSKNVMLPLHETIEVGFPISEMGDVEAKARAFLGVKHGPITDTLGISRREVARALGFQNYHHSRLRFATEDEEYPDLPITEFIETAQATAGEAGLEKTTTEQSSGSTQQPTEQATSDEEN